MILSGWAIYNVSPSLPFTFPCWMTLGGWLAGGIAWHISAMWVMFMDGLPISPTMSSWGISAMTFDLSGQKRCSATSARRSASRLDHPVVATDICLHQRTPVIAGRPLPTHATTLGNELQMPAFRRRSLGHKLDEAINSGDLLTQLSSLRAASEELDPSLRSLIFGKAFKEPRPSAADGRNTVRAGIENAARCFP